MGAGEEAHPWTVGDLRKAIDGIPDSLVVNVNVTCHDTTGAVVGSIPYWIESSAINMTIVGDKDAPEPYSFFELETWDHGHSIVLFLDLPGRGY